MMMMMMKASCCLAAQPHAVESASSLQTLDASEKTLHSPHTHSTQVNTTKYRRTENGVANCNHSRMCGQCFGT